jgi:hypothetical protein
MKNILKATFILMAFSLAIIAFQISCQKSASAQSGGGTTSGISNKIIYQKGDATSVNGATIWIANYDGSSATQISYTIPDGSKLNYAAFSTNAKKVLLKTYISSGTGITEYWIGSFDGTSNITNVAAANISLPTGYNKIFDGGIDGISPDGTKIFITASKGGNGNYIFSCNADGSNVNQVTSGGNEDFHMAW